MDQWLMNWVLPGLIVVGASMVQGIIGFGAGLVSMALLPLLWEVSYAVGVLSPVGALLILSLTIQLREHLELKEAAPLLLAMPFGVVLGLWGLTQWPDELMKALLGTLLLVYALCSGVFRSRSFKVPPVLGALAGFLGGICGAAFNAAAPPVLIYASAMGWEKDRFRANLQMYFMMTICVSLMGLLHMGVVGRHTLLHSAVFLPGVIAGGWVGNRLASRINPVAFKRVVTLALSGMGLAYLYQWYF
jgi:uncharacterized membrane protein YfcA